MTNNMKPEATATTRRITSVNRPAAYVIILLIAYYLGYLSTGIKNPTTITTTTTTTTEVNPLPQTIDVDHYQFNIQCDNPIPPQLVRQTIINRIFNGSSPYNDFPQPHIVPLLRQQNVEGWGSTDLVFKNLIEKVKPKTIIEIGTFLGASAIHMAELTRQLGLDTQIICLDDFRGWPGLPIPIKDVELVVPDPFKDIKMINGDTMLLYQFMQNVDDVNATENIMFLPFTTVASLDKLCLWGVFADLIEVDASHDFHSAWADINRAYKLLRPGGVMFGHDYFNIVDNRGVRRAVDMFARVNGLQVKTDGEHWILDSF